MEIKINGTKVQDYLKSNNMSESVLAERMGTNRTTIRNVLAGGQKQGGAVRTLYLLSVEMKCSMESLIDIK